MAASSASASADDIAAIIASPSLRFCSLSAAMHSLQRTHGSLKMSNPAGVSFFFTFFA
jgi:hypothetical protein